MYNAEYIKKDMTILLREGKTKMLGNISQVFLNEKTDIGKFDKDQKENIASIKPKN